MSETICKCGHDIGEHSVNGCTHVMNPGRHGSEKMKFCFCLLCPSDVEFELLAADVAAARAEVERLTDREKGQAEFVMQTTGSRSLEYFIVVFIDMKEENERMKAALEKYADENNWIDSDRKDENVWVGSPEHGYAIARAALEAFK